MKKLIFVLLAATTLLSCQKKDTETTAQVFQQVSFNTSEILPETVREDWPCKEVDPTHAWVQIYLAGETNPTNYFLELFSVGGKLYTQSVKLAIGNYQVVQFILYQEVNGNQGVQAEDIVTHGTPVQGSEFAGYVNVALPIDFVVAAFEKTEIPIEVLCFIDAEYLAFGFEWFEITIHELDQFCFFGDICLNEQPFAPADFEPEYGTGLGINIPAIMEIVVKIDGAQTAVYNNATDQSEPLCVAYYEDPDVTGEVYTFELYLWLPDGNGFSYQLYHTYISTDGVLDVDIGDDFILDFFVGTCGYGDADQTFDFIWVPPVPPAAGDLVITEIMKDPQTVGDSDGEWFEVYNTSNHAIEMEGLIIRDDDIDSHTIVSNLVIQPFSFLILGINDDPNTNGGVTVDYEYVGITMAQGDDEVVIELDASTIIDQVSYDDGLTFPDPNGASMSLDPGSYNATANDDGTNWCEATSSYGNGDLGTPGAMNDACTGPPAEINPGDLVITEIMQNPAAVGDENGEWFEVYNATDHPIEMRDCLISDLGSDDFIIGSTLIVPANGYVVIGCNADPAANGGVTVQYEYVYPSDFNLANGDDEVIIENADGVEIDRVEYDGGPDFPDPIGASMSFAPSYTADNNVGANWFESTCIALTGGDLGTPGANNICP